MANCLLKRSETAQQLVVLVGMFLSLLAIDFMIKGFLFGDSAESNYASPCVAGIIYGLGFTIPFYFRSYQLQSRFEIDLACVLMVIVGYGLFIVALSKGGYPEDRAVIVSINIWTVGLVQSLLMPTFHCIREFRHVREQAARRESGRSEKDRMPCFAKFR